MKWTGLNDLREKFLTYFESKAHLRLQSYSLIPQGDNSLLLINSGMAPMKKYFTGEVTPPSTKVTNCQKCIRTGDIENVGVTARHGTYFEMLGNFSFGDYFKKEAIAWAWEFFTQVLEMPRELLYISVYLEDDEAYTIWTQDIGVEESHMKRLGKEDNFWEHGSGPCGPCSEIYFDRGEKYGCGSPDCGVGCECDRFVEIWNLVFSQFNSDGKGNYPLMEHPNIDTGMGLERLACVMQGVDNLFLVDTMQSIMGHVTNISGVSYGDDDKLDISLRVITDHIRSTTFMIGDGVLPSNEGRGYVLRRLLRRASRHGKILGIHKPFLSQVAATVIQENKSAYPELTDKQETIEKIILHEEESFTKTIDQGMELLMSFIDKADKKTFSGEQAFLLNDTYGFPLDLTKEILAERGMVVDEDKFRLLMLEQKQRARGARKNAGADAWLGEDAASEGLTPTVFTGYDTMEGTAPVLAIIKEGQLVNAAQTGEQVTIVLSATPFYAESGGQVGDCGELLTPAGKADVADVTKNHSGVFLHRCEVVDGMITVGENASAQVDTVRRKAIMRNHTAAHLLQAALRKVLGTHVEQAGQLVSEGRVRFDFTHFSALTPEELRETELLVNQQIFFSLPVDMRSMPIAEAKNMGAMALFGEKYGDTVRVVSAGDFSLEFCGGTHMDNTAKVGLFKILSETSVASGVRRIEAVTAMGVLEVLEEQGRLLLHTAQSMKISNTADLPAKVQQLTAELHEKDKIIERLNSKLAASNLQGVFQNAQEVAGVRIATALFSGTDSDALRALCDKVKESPDAVVAVFAGISGDKATLAATVSKAAQDKGLKAGQLIKEVAMLTGGNGGGRPDFAMAGAKDQTKLDEALAAVPGLVEQQIR